MDEIKALADSIEAEKIARARQMTPTEKWLAGPALFENACQWMRAGIRSRFPDADDQRVEELLAKQLRSIQQDEVAP